MLYQWNDSPAGNRLTEHVNPDSTDEQEFYDTVSVLPRAALVKAAVEYGMVALAHKRAADVANALLPEQDRLW